MKHKTWFRLMMKAVGVALVGFALPGVASWIAKIIRLWDGNPGAGLLSLFASNPWYIGTLLQFALGLYLFFGGKWIVNLAIPSNRPYCPNCGYDVGKAKGGTCPECGVPLPGLGSERD